MNLNSLKIERALYGERKGSFVAKIVIDDDKSTLALELSEAAAGRLLAVAREELITATHEAALELEQRIASTIPALGGPQS